MNKPNTNLRYLSEHIIKTIALPEFIETEAEVELVWTQPELSAKCCCPLHKESIPSFNMDFKEGAWVYYCFGCGAKGNILHFCKDYHGLRNRLEAINYICKKYNIQNTSDLILEGIKRVKVTINKQRSMENENILVSNQCRMLLRKNFDLHHKWVSLAYRRLNEAMDQGDMASMSKISYEAARRSHFKTETA